MPRLCDVSLNARCGVIICGLGHSNMGCLLVPTLPCEGYLEPVNDGTTIHIDSCINDGHSEYYPCLGGHEVLLEEHFRVRGR